MEAGSLLRPVIPFTRERRHLLSSHRRFPPTFHRFVRVASSLQEGYRGPKPRREWLADLVSENDDAVRSLPIYVGGASLLAVLFNRVVSGIAPVANASSAQSRADLLALGLAVTNILTGLLWLSFRPKTIFPVRGTLRWPPLFGRFGAFAHVVDFDWATWIIVYTWTNHDSPRGSLLGTKSQIFRGTKEKYKYFKGPKCKYCTLVVFLLPPSAVRRSPSKSPSISVVLQALSVPDCGGSRVVGRRGCRSGLQRRSRIWFWVLV